MGDRGLPARVRGVRAVFDRARRADRASRSQAHGGRAPLVTRAWQVRLDRRVQRRSRGAKGRDREPPRRAPNGAALDIRLLVDHREDLVAARTADQQRLRWHLHDLWPELEIPAGALDTGKWLGKISRRLARAQQTTRVRVARELVRQISARTARIRELQAELAALVESYAPQLLAERGCGPLTASRCAGASVGSSSW